MEIFQLHIAVEELSLLLWEQAEALVAPEARAEPEVRTAGMAPEARAEPEGEQERFLSVGQ